MSSRDDVRARILMLFFDQVRPDAEVDFEGLLEALGYSSLQFLAFVKSLNAEFGTNITAEDIENAQGKGGIVSLIPSRSSDADRG